MVLFIILPKLLICKKKVSKLAVNEYLIILITSMILLKIKPDMVLLIILDFVVCILVLVHCNYFKCIISVSPFL